MIKRLYKFELLIFLSAFALYSFLAVFAPRDVWNSPDETANAFFVSRLAEGGGLSAADQAVIRSGGLIHPRSISVSGGLLVPGSFLGMIIFYALPVAFFGVGVLPFLTPLFSALAIIAFGSVLKRFLPERAARISVVLAAAHPAFWYYSARGLFHNAFFLDGLILAIYFFISSPFESLDQKYGSRRGLGAIADGMLGGGFFVLAASARTFELIWAAPLLVLLLWRGRKKIKKIKFLSALAVILFSSLIFGFLFLSLYGYISPGGYQLQDSGSASLLRAVFPFGFSPRNIFWNVWNFGKAIFWWHTGIAWAAVIYIFLRRGEETSLKKYFLLFAIFSLPLILIYGSGRYLDTPDPRFATIGTSTVRYWLPIYIALISFGGWFLNRLLGINRICRVLAILAIAAIFLLSARTVFWGRGEGLVYVLRELRRYELIRSEVISKIPESSIIITDRSDKIFFPLRDVVVGTSSPAVIASLRNLSGIGPLYVYTIAMDENDSRIALYKKAGFIFSLELAFGNERLYRLKSLK